MRRVWRPIGLVVLTLAALVTWADSAYAGYYPTVSQVALDLNSVTAWSVEWQAPTLTNPQEARSAIGQWAFNLETGIYHLPATGKWAVYYFGDDNGFTGNNPDCTDNTWSTGKVCGGALTNLPPGQVVTFTYRRCTTAHVADPAGSQLCAWVNLNDGQGDRFLVEDTPTTVELYTHDVETFGDSGLQTYPEPIVSCSQPVVMRRQFAATTTQPWHQLTGSTAWNLQDHYDANLMNYKYQNVDYANGRWETCSDVGNLAERQPATSTTPCTTGENAGQAVNGTITGGNSDKWCSQVAGDKWLQVDLGSVRPVDKIVVQHAGAGGEPAAYDTRDFTIQLSPDASTWSTPVMVTGNTADVTTHTFAETQARYVRLNVQTPTQTTNPAARIYELEAYDQSGNIARNAPATGSTACSASEGPEKAFNGSVSGGNSDKWCSATSPYSLQVDLGSERGVNKVILRHAEAGGEPAAYNTRDFTLQVSPDNSHWKNVATVTSNTAAVTSHTFTTTEARYVRLDIQAPTQTTNAAARIYEMEVYGN